LIAVDDDYYRKPMTGMWDFFCDQVNLTTITKESFYCGDAAGRKYKKGKDFSMSDLYFAYNIGIKFYTPNELFDHPVSCEVLSLDDNINIDQYLNNTIPEIEKGWKLLDEILTNANYINCKNISTIIILCILS